MTEKLLLYGGAVQLAGSVTARKNQRATTSDWMELEKKRGISISSTVLQFDYAGAFWKSTTAACCFEVKPRSYDTCRSASITAAQSTFFGQRVVHVSQETHCQMASAFSAPIHVAQWHPADELVGASYPYAPSRGQPAVHLPHW